ncbi:MAG TPA: hypothetical protein VHQ68_13580, partial [Propionibacteriaceae bacterium]|nr:hypothetical protein [Propionibacteriaceae bacterium]
ITILASKDSIPMWRQTEGTYEFYETAFHAAEHLTQGSSRRSKTRDVREVHRRGVRRLAGLGVSVGVETVTA